MRNNKLSNVYYRSIKDNREYKYEFLNKNNIGSIVKKNNI